MIRVTPAILVLVGLLALPQHAEARDVRPNDEIARAIVRESREAYYATGHPCACPDDRARNGSACGARSAYSRPGGAQPLCYPRDVTPAMIEEYRARH